MKKIFIVLFIASVTVLSCKQKSSEVSEFLSPEEGASIAAGSSVTLKLNLEGGSFDSVQYLVDTSVVSVKTDTGAVQVSTSGFPLGARLLTARVYNGKDASDITSNILLLPAAAPAKYTYRVVNTYPHDTSSYTQGLEFHDGIFYESGGGTPDRGLGLSSLRKVTPATGKVVKKLDLDGNIFAEGLTMVGDKLIQLTWLNGFGIVYDKNTFQKLKEFPYQSSREGWGLCFDGSRIWKSDGSNRIFMLNKDSYQEQGFIEVYDNKGPVNELNELEYIDGKIYANVYGTDRIVVVNPSTGAVEADMVLSDIAPLADRFETGNVLNGIAWDAAGKRLFVTGKKWPKLFHIELSATSLTAR